MLQTKENWMWGFDQFIREITSPREGTEMRMKDYAVTIEVRGTVTMYVTAPDLEEAEQVAIEEAQNENWNEWDLDLEVNSSEEDSDER